MLSYKYVFFDAGRSVKHGAVDTDEYFYISTSELRNRKDIIMVAYPLDYTWRLIRFAYVASTKLANKISFLTFLNKLWYPFYFNKKINRNDNVCFIVYGYYIKPDYIRYLKKRYKYCKVIKVHRDSYDKWRERNPEYTDNDMINLFDVQYTFDVGDSIKYNMIHFDDFCTKVNDIVINNYPICDIFFAGAAKDRMDLLTQLYDYLSHMGQKCYFYITNCNKEDMVFRKGIRYASKPMSYKQMLYITVNSRIILEVNQKNVDGFTSRFLESIMYNKRLITNNKSVKNNPYYNSDFIMCIDKPEDIKEEFLTDNRNVDFGYKDDFSPIHFIKRIDDYLSKCQ